MHSETVYEDNIMQWLIRCTTGIVLYLYKRTAVSSRRNGQNCFIFYSHAQDEQPLRPNNPSQIRSYYHTYVKRQVCRSAEEAESYYNYCYYKKWLLQKFDFS